MLVDCLLSFLSKSDITVIWSVLWQQMNSIDHNQGTKNNLMLVNRTHTVRKWIYIGHKLPRTFDSSLSIYDINAYIKCLKKLIWTKKKNHVPQGGIEPAPSLVRSGLARIKWKMSSALPTELLGHLYNCAQI